MNTSKRKASEFQRSFVPKTALAKSVHFDKEMMHVHIMDGRVISVPLAWFPVLKRAKAKERTKVEIGGGGIASHWPELDEHLSIGALWPV